MVLHSSLNKWRNAIWLPAENPLAQAEPKGGPYTKRDASKRPSPVECPKRLLLGGVEKMLEQIVEALVSVDDFAAELFVLLRPRLHRIAD